MGIDTERMFALGWGIGAACVGVAGALLSIFFYIFPDVGAIFALLAYVTVALGGFGNVPGTLVAGMVVGLVEVLAGYLFAPALKNVVVFVLYLVVVSGGPRASSGSTRWRRPHGARGSPVFLLRCAVRRRAGLPLRLHATLTRRT